MINYKNQNSIPVIDWKNSNLDEILESSQAQYKKATPFPHVVIDNLFSDELLNSPSRNTSPPHIPLAFTEFFNYLFLPEIEGLPFVFWQINSVKIDRNPCSRLKSIIVGKIFLRACPKSRLTNELNPKHEMMILSRLIPWDSLEVELVEWCGMWKEKLVLQKIFQKSSRQF